MIRGVLRGGLRAAAIGLAALFAAGSASAETKELTAAEAMDAVMWGQEGIGGAFSLTDHDGNRRTEADFRGKVVLIYFGFTFCPDVCPVDLAAIAGGLDLLGDAQDQVQPLFVTLDPERDNAHLGDYLSGFHEGFIGLTGSLDEIRKTANAYKVYYRKAPGLSEDDYSIDHSAFTYMYDKDGAYRGFFPPQSSPQQIADAIRPLLAN